MGQIRRQRMAELETAFAEEYVRNGGNKTAAYLKIHPQARRITAHTAGGKYYMREGVKRRIAELQARAVPPALGSTPMMPADAREVIEGYLHVIRAKITDVCSWNAHGVIALKESAKLPADVAFAIHEITFHPVHGTMRVRMYDKLTALRALGEARGVFNATIEGIEPGAVRLALQMCLNYIHDPEEQDAFICEVGALLAQYDHDFVAGTAAAD